MQKRSYRLILVLFALLLFAGIASAAEALPAANGVQTESLLAFIWLAMGMGALSLLTPCVFPMIPITVSYFTKRAAQSRGAATRNALVYALGIILTFTALGLTLALVFGAAGVNKLAANPWVNLLITAIFLGFALSLFGAYFIQVPPSLMNKLNNATGRAESREFIGTLLMGLTFTLTSFTCTAPFVGTLLVMASQGNWKWPLTGMLAFSTVFAIPFFVFALAPQLMSQLPKAGGWLNSVKVVMGFLEIAAAMKFISNVDLIWRWGIFTRQVVLAVWVAIGILVVLYLLGKFQMSHDSPLASVSALRAVFAIIFLSTSVWLTSGLFGRSLGEIESFLPPTDVSEQKPAAAGGATKPAELTWILNDYKAALAQAKEQNKPIFIDFTGYTCTNCRWMEANIFSRQDVTKELDKFVRVRLYTDGDGEVYENQQKMENDRFGTVALPFYAILNPQDAPVATFAGLTRNPQEFLGFLAKAGRG
jgi:thiol:disulfide interchange protein